MLRYPPRNFLFALLFFACAVSHALPDSVAEKCISAVTRRPAFKAEGLRVTPLGAFWKKSKVPLFKPEENVFHVTVLQILAHVQHHADRTISWEELYHVGAPEAAEAFTPAAVTPIKHLLTYIKSTFQSVDAKFRRFRVTTNGAIWVNPSEEFELVYQAETDSFVYLAKPLALTAMQKGLLTLLLDFAPRIVTREDQRLQVRGRSDSVEPKDKWRRLNKRHADLQKAFLEINPDFSGIENVVGTGNAWIDPLPLGYERDPGRARGPAAK